MKRKIFEAIGITAMAIIVVVAMLIATKWAINFIAWSSLDSGWTQAIGGLMAVWAALYVYLKQARAQETAALITAQLAAIRMINDLAGTIGQARGAAARIRKDNVKVTIATLTNFHDAIFWDRCRMDDVPLLAPLPNRCAQNLAHGFAQFSAARQALYMAVNGAPENHRAFLSNAGLACVALEMGVNYFDAALAEMKKQIDSQAPTATNPSPISSS